MRTRILTLAVRYHPLYANILSSKIKRYICRSNSVLKINRSCWVQWPKFVCHPTSELYAHHITCSFFHYRCGRNDLYFSLHSLKLWMRNYEWHRSRCYSFKYYKWITTLNIRTYYLRWTIFFSKVLFNLLSRNAIKNILYRYL